MTQTAQEYADSLRASSKGPILVDLETHQPTPNELNNLLYLSCKYIGFPMRNCDLSIVNSMSGGTLEGFKSAAAEYIWDHLMGEPESPTQEDVKLIVDAVCDHLFTMPVEVRESVS